MSEDLQVFLLGIVLGFVIAVGVASGVLHVDDSVHKEAELPKTCKVGEVVLMTSAAHGEYYECHATWVRK